MKSKTKIQTPSTTIINDSYGHSSYTSKDISFNDIKREYINKYNSCNMTRKQKSRAIIFYVFKINMKNILLFKII